MRLHQTEVYSTLSIVFYFYVLALNIHAKQQNGKTIEMRAIYSVGNVCIVGKKKYVELLFQTTLYNTFQTECCAYISFSRMFS